MDDIRKFLFPEFVTTEKISEKIKEIAIDVVKLMEMPEFQRIIDQINEMHDSHEKDCEFYMNDEGNRVAIADTSARLTLRYLRAWFEDQKRIVKQIAEERKNENASS